MLIKKFSSELKVDICNFFAYLMIVIYYIFGLLGLHSSPGVFIFIFSFLLFISYDFENPAHYFWCIGFFSFISAPVIGISEFMDDVSYQLLVTLTLSSMIFLHVTKQAKKRKNSVWIKSSLKYSILKFTAACSSSLVLVSIFPIFLHVFPLLLMYLHYLVGKHNAGQSSILVGIFALAMAYYIFYMWSGFGRIIIAVFILCAFWVYWKQHALPFGKLITLFGVLIGPIALGFIRGGDGFREQIQSGNIDSNLSPYLLANDLVAMESVVDPVGLFEQLFLYFFIWIPRDIWAGKPYGFGFEYTVQNLDQSLIDAGHSIASLFVGEHIYYLGGVGFLTSLLSVLLIAITFNYFNKLKNIFKHFSLIIALHIPAFVWGGLASYSARVWLALITFSLFAAVFYFLASYIRFARNHNLRPEPVTSPSP